MNIEISKRDLWKYVNKKINRSIHHLHVINVISILFEEMIVDLKNKKEIKILNFGNIYLHQTRPKKYFDVRFQQLMVSKGRNILKFTPARKFKKFLVSRIDLDRK